MRNGRFYVVGTGPGNPELLTLKAVNTMKACPVIAAAESGGSENVALGTAAKYIEGKEIIMCHMPMIRDEAELDRIHDETAERLAKILDEGKDIAFLTLGDPAVYSSAMYVFQRIKALGYDTEMVPGITSFSAAAAALKVPLVERSEPLHVIPASYRGGEFDDLFGTKIYMKAGRGISDLAERLNGRRAMVAANVSMEGEKLYTRIEDMEDNPGYFSLVIVPAEKGGN